MSITSNTPDTDSFDDQDQNNPSSSPLSSPSSSPKSLFHKNKSALSSHSPPLSNISKSNVNFGRPSYLPPKSTEEIKKQQKQIREFERKMQKREQKMAKRVKETKKVVKKNKKNIVSRAKKFDAIFDAFLRHPNSEKTKKALRTEILLVLPSSSKSRTILWKYFLDHSLVSKSEYIALVHLAKIKRDVAESESTLDMETKNIKNIPHTTSSSSPSPSLLDPTESESTLDMETKNIKNIPHTTSSSPPSPSLLDSPTTTNIQIQLSKSPLISPDNMNSTPDPVPQKQKQKQIKPTPKPVIVTPPTTPRNLSQNLKIFSLDLPRTFPCISFFHENGPLHQPLINVLHAWALFRPDIGYIQGLSNIVSILLLHLDEYDAFLSLAKFVDNPFYSSFLKMNPTALSALYSIHQLLLKTFLPNLFTHFEKLEIEPSTYIIPWYIALFSKTLPLDGVTSIWDGLFLDGYLFIFRSAIGLLSYLSPILLAFSDFGQVLHFLSSLNTSPKEYTTPNILSVQKTLRSKTNPLRKKPKPIKSTIGLPQTIKHVSIETSDLLYHIGEIHFKKPIVDKITSTFYQFKTK